MRRVFLVTGKSSFEASGAAESSGPAFVGRQVHRYCGFSENPKLEDVRTGVDALARGFDVVVGIGGGSVLDMAKLVNTFAAQGVDPLEVISGTTPIRKPGLPLVCIPTTAGSGSEATHFAVVYVDKVKYSVAHETLLPDVALVDPTLTFSLPPATTATTGLDALSQAVESYWCVHSTGQSKRYAGRALRLVLANLTTAVNTPTPEARTSMSLAAHLAGRAINLTKTTGAHALSYPLTSFFGIPHGHAVGLTLGEFFVYNGNVSTDDVTDARGVDYVRRTLARLGRLMGCRNAAECRSTIRSLMHEVGLDARLSAFGVPESAVDLIVRNTNVERMVNNPRALNEDAIRQIITAVL